MQKILSGIQLREADVRTILNEPVSSINLMERAAGKATEWLLQNCREEALYKIICGHGNNGGDGLVIARLLKEKKRKAEVFLCDEEEKYSEDLKISLQRAVSAGIVVKHVSDTMLPDLNKADIVIDALFGSGLNRKPEGLYKTLITIINNSGAEVISIDVPSGLVIDEPSSWPVVRATSTLTFQLPKLAFLFPEGYVAGAVHIIDIGLDTEYIFSATTKNYLLEESDIKKILKPRQAFSHKGSFGHALLIAGSEGKTGAAILAAEACLRSGAGKVTACLPESGFTAMNTVVPEAMTVAAGERYISSLPDISVYSVVGTGPGIGMHDDTARMLKMLIQNCQAPMVFDADALNILADNKTWLAFMAPGCILTPHPGEFTRLVGKTADSFERQEKQREFSKKYNCYVILKGHYSCISCPDGTCYFNTTGNAGMATAGSGDVLTGILTGLLAQGYFPRDAAVIGTYLHGLAGDFAARAKSQESMIASDITANLGNAFIYISSLTKVRE